MKYLKYFLFNIALLVINETQACWNGWYTPKEHLMYRVCNSQPETEVNKHNRNVERNCKEWQSLTSKEIPLDDIHKAVYKMNLEEIESIYDNKSVAYENKFIEWITKKDTAILDFLLLAKTNEHIRLQRNSRWYYPSMKVGARMTIEDIAEKALSVKEERLRSRYLLQAVRAMFSMSRFEECIEVWDNEVCHLPKDDLMRQMIQPYIAGAEFRTNRNDRAIKNFAELGDIKSMLYCAGRTGEKLSTIEAIEMVCEHAPNSNYIPEALQSFFTRYESYDVEKFHSLCLKMARDKRTENPAMWYYTAAYEASRKNELAKADKFLKLAENSRSSDFIDESIKVLRIYLDAKLLPYNSAYEKKLFKQLEWLDSKLCYYFDDTIRYKTAIRFRITIRGRHYYWNDMMQKILLSEICPRMIEAGKTTRALQLANMAENRLLELVDRRKPYDSYLYISDETYTTLAFRYSDKFYNDHDYSNYFFEMIDSIGLDATIQYVDNVNKPKTEFDRFLNSRGYTGNDYLNDILGTQCLRNMRYSDAVRYFANVSSEYRNHHNLYLCYDPFEVEKKKIKNMVDFKYKFSREMQSLEMEISQVTEPNRKAKLMIKFAIGMKNSFGHCWTLTQYYKGREFWGQVCEKRRWEWDNYTIAAEERANTMLKDAFTMFTDDEIAAEMHLKLFNFRTVAEKYPYTNKGKLVRSSCDNLIDHHPQFSY